ncbi:MAG: CRISPR-associated endonuclease Cas2 [Thermoguttaceae bacterium]
MYLVVCYDIVEDRRRARVLRKMGEYLTRVQKSVFEGALGDDRLEPMRRMLMEEIDPVTDTVRLFHLCGRCIPSTEVFGTGTFLETEEADEVV